ncbi:hypothetical protein, partial [Tenuifilum sp.]|uniref:hypothetical protein n=1 Tax=Tenuifilum sp. TaxID=2760880 RepID=UPI00403E6813
MSEKYKQMKAFNTFRKILQSATLLLVVSAFEITPVFGQLTVTIDPSAGQTQVCQGTAFTLTVNANGVGDPPNFTYTWSGDIHLITIVPPYTWVAYLNTNSPAGIYNFTCEVEDEASNKASASISIEILQSPTASISTTDPTTFCQ